VTADVAIRSWVVGVLCLGAVLGAVPAATGEAVYRAPVSIPAHCSDDATAAVAAWIASVPDDAVLSFPRGACYRIEGSIEVGDRHGLDFEGHGATFRSENPATDNRVIWKIVDSRQIALHDMVVRGSYSGGGTFRSDLQHAHAIDVRGSSVEISGVSMSDVAGDCVYFGLGRARGNRSSGAILDSSCRGTGRNAIAVVAGDHILVRHLTTDAIGYDVFDVEPNAGEGFGSNNVRFDSNTIGSYGLQVYSIVENGPIGNQFFTNNEVVGHGLKVSVSDRNGTGFRARRVVVSGNRSDTAQSPAAINVTDVDGLTVTGNTVPMTGGPMVSVVGSCNVGISRNAYPGGSVEAAINPTICAVAPASAPASGKVTIRGSGFLGATRVAVGAVPACFEVDSGARITLVVPRGASTGRITVRTPVGTTRSAAVLTVAGHARASSVCTPTLLSRRRATNTAR
jgi:hypothetical protein